jgi:hypothetical protein
MRALSNSVPSARRGGGRLAIHDLRRQVPAGLGFVRLERDVTVAHGEVLRQPGRRAAAPGQPERPELAEQVPDLPARPGAGIGGDPFLLREEGQPVPERLDVGAAGQRRVIAVVVRTLPLGPTRTP